MCLQSVGKMLSMGYGFVQYQKAEAAQKALRQLQVRLLKLFPLLHPAEPSSQLMCVVCLNPSPALLCGRSPVRAEDFWESNQVRCALIFRGDGGGGLQRNVLFLEMSSNTFAGILRFHARKSKLTRSKRAPKSLCATFLSRPPSGNCGNSSGSHHETGHTFAARWGDYV